jgi:hypothetical protein
MIPAVILALTAAMLQYRGRYIEGGMGIQIVRHWCRHLGDPRIFAAARHGWYYAFENCLGRALAFVGVHNELAVLKPLQLSMWVLQAVFCYGIALVVSKRRSTAILATALYGFGLTLTDYCDMFSYLAGSFGRTAGLTGTLFAIWWWVRGCRTRATLVALAAMYLHADPPVAILIFFILMGGWSPRRWAIIAVGVSPMAWYEFFGEGRFPPGAVHLAIQSSGPAILFYAKAITLRALCALFLVALAYRTTWKGLPITAWFKAVAFLVPIGVLVRILPHPMPFLIQISAGWVWLWPLEFFGRIVLADAAIQCMPMAVALGALCLWNVRMEPLGDDSRPLVLNKELIVGVIAPNCGYAALEELKWKDGFK